MKQFIDFLKDIYTGPDAELFILATAFFAVFLFLIVKGLITGNL